MSTALEFPFLPRASLIQTAERGATLITPNRRLARAIKREFDAGQIKRGRSVWPAADILPYSAFLERSWSELARIERGATLLSAEQETALWERVIADSPQGEILLNPAATASQAREAWSIRHAFRIEFARYAAALDEDSAVFRRWAERYGKICAEKNWLDSARLADAIAASGTVLKPRKIVLYGFDQLSPQQRTFFEALAAAGGSVSEAGPEANAAPAVRTGFPDAEAELYAVASQIKQTLAERLNTRIGVVVPDLSARRADLVRIFDDVLQPARVVSASRERARPYNVSLGLALTDYPLVASALRILELARGELALDDMGSLLRSPFLAAAEQEFTLRALLDASLRRSGRLTVTLKMLAREAHGANTPQLAARLAAWIERAGGARKTKQPPSAWSAVFQQLLAGLGWPGERTLDSEEYQTFGKWREIVSKLSALDLIAPRLGYDEALKNLKRLAGDAPFQPESPEVPVQVLGVLEANALEFDLLFVTGLTDETWPEPPHPNPFLPLAVQRKLNVPHAGADWQLEFARRATGAWRACAKDVRFSYPLRDGDRELRPSPLLREVPEAQPTPADAALYRRAIFAARAVEMLADFKAPRLPAGIEVRGGAEFFKNQAACPFRAFALHRLGATGVEAGHAGLDARDRGLLMHRAAENLWKELKNSKQLAGASEEELKAAVGRAAADALDSMRKKRPDVMTQAFTALEQERVAVLLLRLLELEKNRAPFELLAREKPQRVTVAGVEVSTRPDRMDRLADGSRVILDYKTGRKAGVGNWLGERPDEPQLPLYAVSAGRDDVAAVAFVQLHAQDVLFKGLSREEELLPGVHTIAATKTAAKECAGWAELFEDWRVMLENLAREYLDGRADVSPKDYPKTCRDCDLGTFCRVKEIKDRGPVTEPVLSSVEGEEEDDD
ncbi:MAG TPA: PD-(D/E)XK nuclease family protein [Burkholderiales bacterium]|nr:PD-(D/E)XK nuclease family protein [Burkholderiales bacterium]